MEKAGPIAVRVYPLLLKQEGEKEKKRRSMGTRVVLLLQPSVALRRLARV